MRIAANKFGGIDAGDREMMSDNHPAIHALRKMFRVVYGSGVE
jgi:hypothetical protein